MGEDTPGPVSVMETKTLEPNAIAAAAAANNGNTNTTGVFETLPPPFLQPIQNLRRKLMIRRVTVSMMMMKLMTKTGKVSMMMMRIMMTTMTKLRK